MRQATVALLLAVAAHADEPRKPAPKVPLGKDTTVVTGPLDAEGYVDYQAALNERLGKGITPEKNANVRLWQAFGPRPEGSRMPPAYYKALGIDEPPERADYLISLGSYLKDLALVEPRERDAVYDQYARAMRRPWAAADFPHLDGWLTFNEKPLAVAVEATRRPDYFNPLVAREQGPGALFGALLPSAQKCRELGGGLVIRAMRRVAEGKFDDAWQDLLACHRLGRLVARGGTIIEALVGIALDQIANNADVAHLAHADLTARQARQRLKDLQNLPPMPSLADKIDLTERFFFLDNLQMIRRGGIGMMEGLAGGKVKRPTAKELAALEKIDWTLALRNGNQWYDRMVAGIRHPEYADRAKAFARIEEDFKAMKKNIELMDIIRHVLAGEGDREVGKTISDILLGLHTPAIAKVQGAYDRSEQTQRNLHVAFALAAHRADRGRYPAKLDELAPNYLAAVPGDLFSGKALIYKPAEDGYLLYSVGPNGQDDGGRTIDDRPQGDDLRVRLPLPK